MKKALETHHRFGEGISVSWLLLWLNSMVSSQIGAWEETRNDAFPYLMCTA